jgi:hypothetical protein
MLSSLSPQRFRSRWREAPFSDRAVVLSFQSPFGRRTKGRRAHWKRQRLALARL